MPEPIRFKGTPPGNIKVDFLQVTLANGNVDVLKTLYLPRAMSFQATEALCSGKAYVPVFRSGPWNIKKGVQWLLNQMGGYQLRWRALEEKIQAEQSSKPTWSPSKSELEEGIYHINAVAPECDALNEQTLWILLSIKPDSGSPIAGWPEAKVRQMCQNKSKGLGGAMSMTDFLSEDCFAAAPISAAGQLWHPIAGVPCRGENAIRHHLSNGSWPVSCSPGWW